MNRPVGVCFTQNSRNPRISSAYKLYAFYYFYIVVLSVSVCQKRIKKKCPNNKKEIYNDKYRHTRNRLFGLGCVQPDWGYFEWTEQIISINPYKLIQTFFAMILKNIFIFSK